MSNAEPLGNNFVSLAEHEALLAKLASLQSENEHLIQLVINLKKGLFGSKSEKLNENQL